MTATELKDLNWNKEVTRKGTRISNKEKKNHKPLEIPESQIINNTEQRTLIHRKP